MVDREYVDEELAKARQAFRDAERLASSGGSDAGVVNRLYYACFHGAQAVLYDRGVDPSTHGGVRRRFGEEVVLQGDATRDEGRLLTTLADLRQQADYGYDPIDVEIAALLDRTEQFVEARAARLEDGDTGNE